MTKEQLICANCGNPVQGHWSIISPGVVYCDRPDCWKKVQEMNERAKREERERMLLERKCIYHEDYAASPCCQETVDGFAFCKEHLGVKCKKCGKQATGAKGYCSIGVIYTPLCDECYEKTF